MKKTFHLLPLALLMISCNPVLPIKDPFTAPRETAGESQPVHNVPLRIYVLDVGQGDSTLIVGPGGPGGPGGPSGKTLLIDAGRHGEGVATVLPHLAELGIDHLNWIVATHYDADHIGGIPEVMKGPDQVLGTDDDVIPTEEVLDRGDFTDKSTPAYKEYLSIAQPYRNEAEPGMRLELGDDAHADVIVVNGRYADGRSIPLNPDEENEACIGLLVEYGGFRYFTAGDLTGGGAPGGYETKDMETIAGEIMGDIDVLHVGHHGSSSSTNETLLEETKPEGAIISVGKDNDYGHPTEEVLTRLERAGTAVYRTDQMGTIEIQTNGSGYQITPR